MGKISEMATKYFTKEQTPEKKTTKDLKPTPVNQYAIQVDIQGIVFQDEYGSRIEYREIADYNKNNFPVRILTIRVHPKEFAELFHLEKETVNGFGELYNVKLFVSPISDEGILNKAFEDGEFKGLLINNDSDYEFTSTIDEESLIYSKPDRDPRTEITFYLYRENELTFSTSNNINFLYPNPKLSDVFINSLYKSNPNLKCIVSKFDHDPTLGLYLVRDMSFTDLIDTLEDEVGFYKTDYMCFVEYNILFFLNKSNEINCSNEELERAIHIQAGRLTEKRTTKLVIKMDDYNYACTVPIEKVRVVKDTKATIRKSYSYITPSGKKIDHINSLSRNTVTIRKVTEAEPIQKTNNIQYEMIEVVIDENSVNFLNPLSKIYFFDSNGVKRTYRMALKEINVVSSISSYVRIVGFRVL